MSSERQVKDFAVIVNTAIAVGGVQECAFGACLLDHPAKIGAIKPLKKFLFQPA